MKKEKAIILEHEFEEEDIEELRVHDPAHLTQEEKEERAQTTKNIINRQKEINEQLEGLDEETKAVMLEEMLKEYGLTTKELTKTMGNLDPALPPSMIFNNLGWYPISMMLQRIELRFKFANIIPFVIVKNGLKQNFYRDFRKVDGLSAYKQEDYKFEPIHNPLGGIVVYEIWKVYRNIHMGFTMWDTALNQVTRDISLFIAMFNELEFNMMTPISVIFYRMRLKMIALDIEWDGTLDNQSGVATGTDWSTLTPDVTIDGTDDYDALMGLFNFFEGMNQPSRKNLPTRWNPTGLENNLMTQFNMNDFVLIVPIAFEQYLKVKMKSGRFHDKYLNILPEVIGIDYDKAFGEFNGDTKYTTKYNDCDLRLVHKGSERSGAIIMAQYEGLRAQPNLNLTSVAHFWTLVGHAFHRATPFFRIKFKSAGEDNGGGEGRSD